jgi:hypothetical protein
MLFDLTFPCYLTTFSGKKCLIGKVTCVFFVPLIEVLLSIGVQKSLANPKKGMFRELPTLHQIVASCVHAN